MELAPGGTLGRYRLLERAGAGGMAEVWKAVQPSLDRIVAIKVLPRHLASEPGYLERFRREARAISRLDHPNILGIHDFGEDDDFTYMVMPFLAGGTLSRSLGRPWSVQAAVRILEPLAAALDHAHSRGLVHRDVKPANVLIGEGGRVVLADFGIARMTEGSLASTGGAGMVGTPAYMSPEQVQGVPTSPASDQYSLGVVAYEMLTGRRPFDAETPLAVALAHVHRPLPPPRTLNPDISPDTERVLFNALAKQPGDRYVSVSEFVRSLGRSIRLPDQAPEVVVRAPPESETPASHRTVQESSTPGASWGSPHSPPPSQPAASAGPGKDRASQRQGSRQLVRLIGGVCLLVLVIWGATFAMSSGQGSQTGATTRFAQTGPTATPRIVAPPSPSAGEQAEKEADGIIAQAKQLTEGEQPDAEKAVDLLNDLSLRLPLESPKRSMVDDLMIRALLEDADRRVAVALGLKDQNGGSDSRQVLTEADDRAQRAGAVRPDDRDVQARVIRSRDQVELAGWWLDYSAAYNVKDTDPGSNDRQLEILQKIVAKEPDYATGEGSAKDKLYAAWIAAAKQAWNRRQPDLANRDLDDAAAIDPGNPMVAQVRAEWLTPTAVPAQPRAAPAQPLPPSIQPILPFIIQPANRRPAGQPARTLTPTPSP